MSSPHDGYARDDNPSPRPRVIPLEKILGNDIHQVVILSNWVHGFWTHWMDDRTQPCLNDERLCPGHLRKAPLKWNGYLHVFDPRSQKNYFIELTDFAWEGFRKQLGERKCLHGLSITVRREKGHKRSPLAITLTGELPSHKKLPFGSDPLPTLKRVWKTEN